jgi:hypothetical protein
VTDVGERLVAVLEHARDRGYLGPGPVATHVAHAHGFVALAERLLGHTPATAADLGSGGGVPGLVLAAAWPNCTVMLVEVGRRRAQDLTAAATELFDDRVEVVAERAEIVAHEPRARERFDLVTARSFGPPALTSEIGAGFVAPGGWLLVSEPPGGDVDRWPSHALRGLGFGPAVLETVHNLTFAALPKRQAAPAGIPRPTKPLVKRPAW